MQSAPVNISDAETAGVSIVTVHGLVKTWGGVNAVEVDHWSLRAGEIHALAGENGAGKSTLLKMVAGIVTPDAGTISLDGTELSTVSLAEARAHGVTFVHQELAYAPLMTVCEAMALVAGFPTRAGLVRWSELRREVQAKLDEWELGVSATATMKSLTTAEKVAVGTLAAVMQDPRIVILDEPTASLSAKEVDRMHALVRRLQASGCAVVYVTHRLDEIFELCDRVTVMRNGRHIWTQDTDELTKPDLVEAIAGRPIDKPTTDFSESRLTGPPLLDVRELRVGRFGPLTLSVAPGEIVALAGLVGAGRTELLESIFGIRRATSGHVSAGSQTGPFSNPRQGVAARVGMIPEERRAAGLVMDMSVRENMMLATGSQYSRRFLRLLRKRAQRADVESMAVKVKLKTVSIESPVRTLSGGNQQKVLLGRLLLSAPDVLILDEPTRGVDIGAREEIFELVRTVAAEGKAVVLTSADLEDLEGLVHRAIVIQEGKVVGELHGRQISADRILDLCFAQAR